MITLSDPTRTRLKKSRSDTGSLTDVYYHEVEAGDLTDEIHNEDTGLFTQVTNFPTLENLNYTGKTGTIWEVVPSWGLRLIYLN